MHPSLQKLDSELRPRLEERFASLEQTNQFARVRLIADFDPGHLYTWRLYCHSHGEAKWKCLTLGITVILIENQAVGCGSIDWIFPRARGQMPRPGREYGTSTGHHSMEEMVNRLLQELPALFRAFDRVVERG